MGDGAIQDCVGSPCTTTPPSTTTTAPTPTPTGKTSSVAPPSTPTPTPTPTCFYPSETTDCQEQCREKCHVIDHRYGSSKKPATASTNCTLGCCCKPGWVLDDHDECVQEHYCFCWD